VRARGNGTNGRHGRIDHVQHDALRRGEVMQIARLRFGSVQLPDDDVGRLFLRTLVALKFPHEDMDAIAPWWRDADLVGAKRVLDPDRIGNAIEFTFKELLQLAKRHIIITKVAPCDADRGRVQAFWERRGRRLGRIRKRRDRANAKEAQMEKLPQRTELVRRALGSGWQPKSAIERRVAPLLGLGKVATHTAVTREIHKLVALGLAEQTIKPGTNGFPTCMVRLVHRQADQRADQHAAA
jgi:hypothetical protein